MAGGLARVAGPRHGVDIGPGRVQGHVHVRHLGLDELEGTDGLAELAALADIGHDQVQAGLHDAQRPARQHRPLVVQPAHQDADAAVHRPHDAVLGDLAVLEDQLGGVGAAHAHLVELGTGGEAGETALDQEGGDAPGAGVWICAGIDHKDVGVGAVGDPELGSVEDIAVASPLGAQAHGDDVRARSRLAHGQGADMLARDQPGQMAGLLGLGSPAADLVHAKVGMGAVGQAHRGRGPGDLLHGHHMLEIAQAGAAILGLHRKAQEAQGAHLWPEVAGEGVVPVDGRGARGDALGSETGDGGPQGVGGLTQGEVEFRLAHGP